MMTAQPTADYKRTILVGVSPRKGDVEVQVQISEKGGKTRLSMQGSVWRRDRKDIESGGQNQDTIRQDIARLFIPEAQLTRMLEIWERWHLNDMRAACEHQRARGETWATHPSAKCPDCGYSLGSAWLYEAIPDEVLAEVRSW